MGTNNTVLGDEIYGRLPTQDLRDGMEGYIEKRLPPGHYLEAVLSNELFDAVHRADATNERYLVELVGWIWEYAPINCYGNPAKVTGWLEGRL